MLVAIRAFGVEHTGREIALPATFVLREDGAVLWHHVGETPLDRPDSDHVVAELHRLQARGFRRTVGD